VFVVHACWLGLSTLRLGGLGIWGEDSSAPTTPPRRPGRAPRIQPHPYAVTHAELIALLPPDAWRRAGRFARTGQGRDRRGERGPASRTVASPRPGARTRSGFRPTAQP
jgi:hypothetical protein